MTELRLRGQSHWESNRSPQRLVNAVEPTVVVKCLGRQPLSTSVVEPLTTRQEQQLLLQQHLQKQRIQYEKHQLQQQVQRQIEQEQQQMKEEQQQKQQQKQHEHQQQHLKQQTQRQMLEEQQLHNQQHMRNEQEQQRRQQLMQHDQQQQQQQQQDALTISRQSSPGHSACSSTFLSSSTPSTCSSTISCPFTLSTCSSSLPSDSSDSDRYKTELCRSYEENGTCRYGNKCLFAHGRGELRLLDRHPKYKTEFCRTYHSSGFCPYGQRCHFIHSCQNSPLLAGASPGLAFRPGEGSLIGPIGQLPMVLVATGREWNEAQGKFVEPERRFSELEQRFSEEARRFNDPERLRNDMERKLAEMELERSTIEHDKIHLELERKSLEPNWKIIQPERRFIDAERKPLELELSAILQRRRRQLRCGSVGSSCETPPPFMVGLDNFNHSRTSSPMLLDEIRSPSFATPSPLTTHSNPVDIPHSGAARYGPVSRNLKGSPGLPTNHLGLSFTPPKEIGSVQTPPWTLGDALAPRSASRTSSPGLHQFVTRSSAARQQGTFFLFDGDTLAKLIQRS